MSPHDLERIIFVPVIHTDKESIERARKMVREIKPDVVAVELDKDRYNQLLNQNQEADISKPVTGDPTQDMLNQIALLLKNFGQQTGAGVGQEMLAAIEEGRAHGSKIALVDRPIQATMYAISQVPLEEIYKLTYSVPETEEDIANIGVQGLLAMLKDDAKVDELLAEFRKEFPRLTEALIDQRDDYVASALHAILNDVEGKIVAVLGAGHIEGVTRILKERLRSDAAG
ncbi:MAG: hypothetical protein BAJATHORv1_10412 [Candidatus Thorarchaeota archaeon]|nr:MAG: hypothetical protein BAJATHORv1_10412 [Candidatus Thorarchaeota archaeon]